MQPDSIDQKIIDILVKDHLNNNEIARRLGLSEGAIRQRIKKLKAVGALKIRGVIDPEIMANKQVAYIAADVTATRYLDDTARAVSEISHVLSVSLVAGTHDLIIEVLVDSNQGLVKFLTDQLSMIDNIARTETFLILKSYNKYV